MAGNAHVKESALTDLGSGYVILSLRTLFSYAVEENKHLIVCNKVIEPHEK